MKWGSSYLYRWICVAQPFASVWWIATIWSSGIWWVIACAAVCSTTIKWKQWILHAATLPWRRLLLYNDEGYSLPPLSGGRRTLSSMDDNNVTSALVSTHQLICSNFVVAIVAVSQHAFNLTFCALNSILKYNKFQIAFCLLQNSSFFWKIVRNLFLDGMRNLIHYVANKSIVS